MRKYFVFSQARGRRGRQKAPRPAQRSLGGHFFSEIGGTLEQIKPIVTGQQEKMVLQQEYEARNMIWYDWYIYV